MKVISNIRDWYGRYERPVSSLSLIGGFVFDIIALKRIDMFWENLWVLGHIVLVAVFMALVHRVPSAAGDEADPRKVHFWLVNILQFVFGGLLSVFLVFYFRSSDLTVSWPFILILAVAFWANESLKRQFVRMTFQVALFFLSVFLSAIFLVPIIIHQIGPGSFILSGIISILLMHGFLALLARANKKKFEESRRSIVVSIGCIFIGMNLLYFTNLIPPIPLSLKDSGVYHSIRKSGFEYTAEYEDIGWKRYLMLHDDFHTTAAGTVYAYSAVFSPTALNTTIVHQWQYYDDEFNVWIDFDKVFLSLVGGREGGFRTFSQSSGLKPGKWRVTVATPSGQVLGQIRFTVIPAASVPPLSTKTLE